MGLLAILGISEKYQHLVIFAPLVRMHTSFNQMVVNIDIIALARATVINTY